MRKVFFVLAFLLSTHAYSQITMMNTEIQKLKYDNFAYDSLRNMSTGKYEDKYTYHHLVGQTLMYCGNSDSYRTRSDFKIGDYYRVDGILPDDTGKGLYHRLSLTNISTGEKCEEGGIFTEEYNFKWVVLGHYEKMKALYINKEFVFVGFDHYRAIYGYKSDGFIHLETDTISRNIPKESVWRCVDVQVKPRKKDYESGLGKRSPIVLVFDNQSYGKHYCYLEDESGEPYKALLDETKPLICGRFQLKSYYDTIKTLNIAAKNRRKAELVKKYGSSNANLILQGKIRTGMTKSMCADAWGSPSDINKTTGSFGVHEQWVYGLGSYVYFENGVITTIQN